MENHPSGEFVIVSLAPYQESDSISTEKEEEFSIGDPNFMVKGNLTLRGTTKSITFPARIDLSDEKLNISTSFNIDRTEWGISFRDETKVEGRIKDKFIHNKVNVGFDLEIMII